MTQKSIHGLSAHFIFVPRKSAQRIPAVQPDLALVTSFNNVRNCGFMWTTEALQLIPLISLRSTSQLS